MQRLDHRAFNFYRAIFYAQTFKPLLRLQQQCIEQLKFIRTALECNVALPCNIRVPKTPFVAFQ